MKKKKEFGMPTQVAQLIATENRSKETIALFVGMLRFENHDFVCRFFANFTQELLLAQGARNNPLK